MKEEKADRLKDLDVQKFKDSCKEKQIKHKKEIERHESLIIEQGSYGKFYKPKGWLNDKCPNCGERLYMNCIEYTNRYFLKCRKCEYEYAKFGI